ncbi:MAG TPA: YtxH domain-containing protein [Terriglobia bacterium]|jgi:gas vesicle protein
MNINVSDKIIYLGAGCGIGMILGLLFAPQSGEEIRHTLTHKMDDLTHKVQDKISHSGIGDTASQTWNSVVEKGKNVAQIGRQRLNESMESGKRKYNESIETGDFSER